MVIDPLRTLIRMEKEMKEIPTGHNKLAPYANYPFVFITDPASGVSKLQEVVSFFNKNIPDERLTFFFLI
jgi:hypothetical protein